MPVFLLFLTALSKGPFGGEEERVGRRAHEKEEKENARQPTLERRSGKKIETDGGERVKNPSVS